MANVRFPNVGQACAVVSTLLSSGIRTHVLTTSRTTGSCWDGQNLYRADHMGHISYPESGTLRE